jgi:DNA topoisomerase-3
MRLVICEKPSQAQTFSAVLNAKKRGDGFFEGNGWIISWCYGHLVELAPADAYGEQYKKWAYETLPFLPDASGDAWQYQVSANKKKQFNVLRSLMKRSDVKSIVCATDAGREGELIFRLVYEQAKCNKPIQRLWISSLEDEAVRKGFASLRPGSEFDNLYKAALCRAKADYLVGINATRLFSCLYGATLNVGRVQSPTLALIVMREAAVRHFVSEPFYTPRD